MTSPKNGPSLTLKVLSETFAICRLPADAEFLDRSKSSALLAITRTRDELSIVCEESLAPMNAKVETGWRALKVKGPLDFSLTGILSSIASPLAREKISIFAISTFDTDYVLVKAKDLEAATSALRSEGFTVEAK